MEDTELVEAAREGDRNAFDELVRRTFADTYTLACRLTGHEEDGADVVQEAYLRAWKAIGRFRGDAQFSTWLYRITANTAATHKRRRRRYRSEPLGEEHHPVEARIAVRPAESFESAESLAQLAAAVESLPEPLRMVVVLRDVYDLPHEAIAEELGITEGAAKVRLHRARRHLRDLLYEQGAAADAV